MNSMEEQYGFDANFTSEVPDYLKCVVCHLVMRQPVQIMTCGHRFCKPCFERIKGYSQHLNTGLCCPIDREPIDINKVFDDTGIARDVGNLQIMCSRNDNGCTWRGDLRSMQSHADECQYQLDVTLQDQPSIKGVEVDSTLLNELCRRMAKCEEAIVEKEKDVAYLKYNLHELKKSFNEKEEQVDALKNKNSNIEEELKMMKEKNQELKHLEIKTENLMLKNQLLEKQVNSIENQLLVTQKQLQDQQGEITSVKQEVEDVRSNLSENIKDFQSSTNEDVKKLKEEVNNVNNERKDIRSCLDNKTDQLNNLSTQITSTEKVIKENFNRLNEKIDKEAEGVNLMKDCQKEADEKMKNIADLKHHVTNIENVLFCDSSNGSKEVVIQWKLQNYQYHFDIGKDVFSPIFLTQVKGYCFKLKVKWSVEEKEILGLFLQVCRGSNYDKPLKPFKIPYSLEMVDNKGKILSIKIPLSSIEVNRDNCFTLHPGENQCKEACGFANFISMHDLNNYIVNDMLSIQCRLTPL